MIWQEEKKPISLTPTDRKLMGHLVMEEGVFPKKSHFVIFEYPDCFRKYDGNKWTVIEKERGMDLTVFEVLEEGK